MNSAEMAVPAHRPMSPVRNVPMLDTVDNEYDTVLTVPEEMSKKPARQYRPVECPHCNGEIPREYLKKKLGKQWVWQTAGEFSAERSKDVSGRLPVVRVCGCGFMSGAREIRQHECSQKPPRGRERKASPMERAAYFAGAKNVSEMESVLGRLGKDRREEFLSAFLGQK